MSDTAVIRVHARPRVHASAEGTTVWITPGRAHTGPERMRSDRSRQRAAAFGRRRAPWRHRSPPRLGAVVFRHNPDRSLRRGPDGRRRFRVARRRDQFRHRAGARRERAARRHRRDRRQARRTARADRLPPAGETNAARQVIRVSHHQPRRRPRGGARAPVRARLRQPDAVGIRVRRQHPALQSRRSMLADGRRRRRAGRRAAGARSPTPKSPSSRAISRRCCRASRSPAPLPIDDVIARVRDTAELDRRHAGSRYQVASVAARRRRRSPMPPTATPTPMPASRPASFPRTSRCCPRPAAQTTGGNGWNERVDHRQERRQHRDDPQRSRRHAGRDQGDRRRARPARPRRRPEGRPEAAHPARADRRRHAAAADPRDRHRRRQRDRSRGRAVRLGRYVSVDVASIEHRGRRGRATTTTRTTARACGSTRASTRPRCATRFRAR